MVVGFLVTVIWVVVFKADFYDLYEMIPGFIAGLGTIVVVSLMTGGGTGGQAVGAVRRSVMRRPPFLESMLFLIVV